MMVIEAWPIAKAKKPWAPKNIVRLLGLTLIVVVAALLVIAGYGKDQIGPVMGFLGVIVHLLMAFYSLNSVSGFSRPHHSKQVVCWVSHSGQRGCQHMIS